MTSFQHFSKNSFSANGTERNGIERNGTKRNAEVLSKISGKDCLSGGYPEKYLLISYDHNLGSRALS